MNSKPKVLIVDDDPNLVQSVSEALEFAGYHTVNAANGAEALERARLERPTVIVLDAMMPVMDGYQACTTLKQDPDTGDIPILMLTAKARKSDRIQGFEAGADQYLVKPFDLAELKVRLDSMVQSRKAHQVAPADTGKISLYITLDKSLGFQIELRGAESFVGEGGELDVDLEELQRRAKNLGEYLLSTDQWRFEAKSLGKLLYRRLFKDSPVLTGRYNAACARVSAKDLCLYFRGGRENLGLAFELLFDGRDYLVLQHPMARVVSDIPRSGTKTARPFDSHLRHLAGEGKKLRILMIEANTIPPMESVRKEIDELTLLFQKELVHSIVEKEITVVRAQDATYDYVTKLVETGRFDMVHYAGHALSRDNSPERSALVLWKNQDSDKPVALPAYALVDLVRDNNIQFFYMSSCLGADTGSQTSLWDNDFLGLTDGLVQAGVPSVLGFRWVVSDLGARKFSQSFYRALFGGAQGVLEDALFRARRESARATRDDPTWLSPMLVTQVSG